MYESQTCSQVRRPANSNVPAQLDDANSVFNLHFYCCFPFSIRVTARLHSVMAPRWLRWGLQLQLHCAQGPSLPVAAAQQCRQMSNHQEHAARGPTEALRESDSGQKPPPPRGGSCLHAISAQCV